MIDKGKLFDLLESKGIEYERFDHIPVYTVVEAERIDIPNKEKVLKNLFLKDKKGRYYLVSLNAGKKIDLKKLRSFLSSSHLHFEGEEDLYEVTGLRAGHVTPFGILNTRGFPAVSVFDSCLEGDIIGVHPMRNDSTVFLEFDDVRKLIEDEGFETLMYEVE